MNIVHLTFVCKRSGTMNIVHLTFVCNRSGTIKHRRLPILNLMCRSWCKHLNGTNITKFKSFNFCCLSVTRRCYTLPRGQHCHIYVPSNIIKQPKTQSDRCFLDAFAKLRKTTISCVMSVYSSLCMEQLGSNWTNFDEIWYLRTFRICREKSSFIKIWQESRVLYMKTYVHSV